MNPMLESTIEITEETFTQENGPIVNETEKNMSKWNRYIYLTVMYKPYGSKYLLRRYFTPQIVP